MHFVLLKIRPRKAVWLLNTLPRQELANRLDLIRADQAWAVASAGHFKDLGFGACGLHFLDGVCR